MYIEDTIHYAWQAMVRHKLRSILMLVAMSIGVASIIILTSLGESARSYIVNEFASLGTNLLIVLPGRSETQGGAPALFAGETPRDLTAEDAAALRRVSGVSRVSPVILGAATVSYNRLSRESPIIGSSNEMLHIRRWTMSQGKFIPEMDYDLAASVCVIGSTIQKELFGNNPVLGEWLRIGERRFRVIGVLASEGRSIGIDVENIVMIPVASAQQLFNTPSLFRIFVEAKSRDNIEYLKSAILKIISERHQGEQDVTVVTQDSVLSTFDKIFSALTFAVASIAAISLSVAGVLIMNVMLVSVTQRTNEIGLLKAIGATKRKIIYLFLTEAILLASLGAIIGIAIGLSVNYVVASFYPKFIVAAPAWALLSAATVPLLIGAVFGSFPAKRAAELDPIVALASK